MIKTIPVISGRDFLLNPREEGGFYACELRENFTKGVEPTDDEIHVAEVVSSIQLDDLKKLIEALDYYAKAYINGGAYTGTLHISKVHGEDIENLGSFAIAGKLARLTLTTFRERYKFILNRGEK